MSTRTRTLPAGMVTSFGPAGAAGGVGGGVGVAIIKENKEHNMGLSATFQRYL